MIILCILIVEWWSTFGASTPNIQEFVVRVLSLTVEMEMGRTRLGLTLLSIKLILCFSVYLHSESDYAYSNFAPTRMLRLSDLGWNSDYYQVLLLKLLRITVTVSTWCFCFTKLLIIWLVCSFLCLSIHKIREKKKQIRIYVFFE